MKKQEEDRPYAINDKRVGKRIKKARITMNLTQAQLAKAVDVTPAFIGYIERGEKSLSLNTLLRITKTLNLPVDYLLSNEKKDSNEKFMNAINQLLCDRPLKTKKAVLTIVRAALKYLD